MSEKTGKTTPEQDRGKFGFPRRADDGFRAEQAARLNNEPRVDELIDGRCSYDGLPEGNCAHFPGVQAVIVPGYEGTYSSDELGEDGIPTEAARARWHQEHSGNLRQDGDHATTEKPAAVRAKSDPRDTK